MTRSWQADAVGPPKSDVSMLVAEWQAENAGLRAAWEQAVAERDRLRTALTDTTEALAKFVNTKAETREPYETALSAYDRGIAALKPIERLWEAPLRQWQWKDMTNPLMWMDGFPPKGHEHRCNARTIFAALKPDITTEK